MTDPTDPIEQAITESTITTRQEAVTIARLLVTDIRDARETKLDHILEAAQEKAEKLVMYLNGKDPVGA